MNTLIKEPFAKNLSFDNDNMKVSLTDGRILSIPLVFFPRLLNANVTQRKKFIISGGGIGLHWDELDEDINVKNLLLGIGDITNTKSKHLFS